MIFNRFYLAFLSFVSFGAVTQENGAQAAVAQTAYPLLGKALFSPQKTTSIIHFLLKSKSTLQTASLIGGGITFLIHLYKHVFEPPKYSGENILANGVAWGCVIPIVTYLGLELANVPATGLLTMLAGE